MASIHTTTPVCAVGFFKRSFPWKLLFGYALGRSTYYLQLVSGRKESYHPKDILQKAMVLPVATGYTMCTAPIKVFYDLQRIEYALTWTSPPNYLKINEYTDVIFR